MKPRHLTARLRAAAAQLPVVSVTGPRQSGKTTLVRAVFPQLTYLSLEEPHIREEATEDPRGLLARLGSGAVLDEVQRAPELFSYLQGVVDEDPRPGRFVLTGSENFLPAQRISQSLAGRCAVLHLLPFSLSELREQPPLDPDLFDRDAGLAAVPEAGGPDLDETMLRGLFPRVHEPGVDAALWLSSYERTYVERDVRQIVNIGQLQTFQRFLRLCAGRTGRMLNLASLANDTGVSAPTVRSWLSVLEASFIVRWLPPHHANFHKRLIKTPKMHFLDSGLLCRLLGIRSAADLRHHPLRGGIFESFVVAELTKAFVHRGQDAPLFFWRDRTGHEIDVLVDLGSRLVPWEVKSTSTVRSAHFDTLRWWEGLAGKEHGPGGLIHGGLETWRRGDFVCRSWRHCS